MAVKRRSTIVRTPDIDRTLDLEQLVDHKVRDQLTAMNGTLEGLIRQALDRQLTQMIGQLVEAELEDCIRVTPSGNAPLPEDRANPSRVKDLGEPLGAPSGPATKVCVGCGQEKPLDAFEQGRQRCRACRREQVRQRRRQQADTDDQERPRTDGQAS